MDRQTLKSLEDKRAQAAVTLKELFNTLDSGSAEDKRAQAAVTLKELFNTLDSGSAEEIRELKKNFESADNMVRYGNTLRSIRAYRVLAAENIERRRCLGLTALYDDLCALEYGLIVLKERIALSDKE